MLFINNLLVCFFQDATGEEFKVILQLVGNTHIAKTVTGQREIVKMIEKHADLDHTFDLHESDNYSLHIITLCINSALPFFSVSIII